MPHRAASSPPSRTTPPAPERTRGSYANPAGELAYELYRPGIVRKPPPLIVMLHGCSQSAADFAAGTRMDELADACGALVLYPEQSRCASPIGCWSWYDTRHQAADGGEPSLIAGMTRQVMAEHGVDAGRVYVAGMSAGGAMAAILGQAYPDLYAAIGVHSGLPSGAAHDVMSALRAMSLGPLQEPDPGAPAGVATIVFHGDRDMTVHPRNAEAIHARACGSRENMAAPAVADMPLCGAGRRRVTRMRHAPPRGAAEAELWMVHGAGHAWAGGSPAGSYTDETGPDASREMLRFFLRQRLAPRVRAARAAARAPAAAA